MKRLSDLDELNFQDFRLEKVSSLTNLNFFQRKEHSQPKKSVMKEKILDQQQVENFKFFHLPANQIEALKKKLKLNYKDKLAPTQAQIKQYLNSHSLRYLIYKLDLDDLKQPINLKKNKNVQQLNSNKSQNVEPFNQQKRLSINQYKIQHLLNQKKSSKNFQVRKQNFFLQIPKSQYHRQLKFDQSQDEINEKNKTDNNFPFEEKIIIKQAKKNENQNDIQVRFKKIKRVLKQNLLKLKVLGLKPKQVLKLLNNRIFSRKAFQKQYSYEFIQAAKNNDEEQLKAYLKINPYLVFDFDYYNMTALHWACLKGNYRICQILLYYKSDVDRSDLLGRSPLYISIQRNHLEIVKVLLYYGASPWSNDQSNLIDVIVQNSEIQQIISKARKSEIALLLAKQNMKKQMKDNFDKELRDSLGDLYKRVKYK